ncbi:MAG: hypothetical protein M1820_006301 [Bogoriella megaspora]|nr:MAG: hypothetical protein M1820_006301 [Bogoriella megaspora]
MSRSEAPGGFFMTCDLKIGTCGQCVRAGVTCSGYRDPHQIRIENQTETIVTKALEKTSGHELRALPLCVESQAREAFFAHYVTGITRCWSFLRPYYQPNEHVGHLKLAIQAVSLAYLWHQVYSEESLALARKKYMSALKALRADLKDSKQATKDVTLLVSLLLDLFEKITGSEAQNSMPWSSHVNGALALVKFRGLETFQDSSQFSLLTRINQNYMATCMATASVPDEWTKIRNFLGDRSNDQRPTRRLSDLMVRYADLRSQLDTGLLSNEDAIEACVGLDSNLQALELDLPQSWQHQTTLIDHTSDNILDLHYDTYLHRNICQAVNFRRLIRILLNETVIDRYTILSLDSESAELLQIAQANIEEISSAICASVPQYVDCEAAARDKLLEPDGHRARHTHSPSHRADCYSLILPLYAVGRSKIHQDVRVWVLRQLRYMGSHFWIRNAELVAQILENGTDVSIWNVYAMLGSYAFTA